MDCNLNVLALAKDGECFIFLYDNHSTPQVLQTLGKFAADLELCFTWYDAAVLSQKVRKGQLTDCQFQQLQSRVRQELASKGVEIIMAEGNSTYAEMQRLNRLSNRWFWGTIALVVVGTAAGIYAWMY